MAVWGMRVRGTALTGWVLASCKIACGATRPRRRRIAARTPMMSPPASHSQISNALGPSRQVMSGFAAIQLASVQRSSSIWIDLGAPTEALAAASHLTLMGRKRPRGLVESCSGGSRPPRLSAILEPSRPRRFSSKRACAAAISTNLALRHRSVVVAHPLARVVPGCQYRKMGPAPLETNLVRTM